VLDHVHRLIDSPEFLADFEPFVSTVARAGERSALGQLLLKLTCPGVPDVYQGDELWRLSLVDPDNRREVDWDRRRGLLEELKDGAAPTRETVKLHLIRVALELRRRRTAAFSGVYTPIGAGERVCAYMRGEEVLTIVRIAGAEGAQLETPLAGDWRDVLTGRELTFAGERSVDALVDGDGLALLERLGV
jgi:(1->4)-alpha-D-glucan 1-alpha-D-glucosylmutase